MFDSKSENGDRAVEAVSEAGVRVRARAGAKARVRARARRSSQG